MNGDPRVAAARLFDGLGRSPGIALVAATLRTLHSVRETIAPVRQRIAVAGTFTLDALRAALDLQALRAGINAEWFFAPYGQVEQELIDPASGISQFKPDTVIVAARLMDGAPALYNAFNSLSPHDADALVTDYTTRLVSALTAFRAHSSALLLIQNWELPARPALGIADASAAMSQIALIQRANDQLRAAIARLPDAYIMDYDALIARVGRDAWSDPRMAYFARIPVAPAHYWILTGFYVAHLRPLLGLSKKVLCLDADHTLWGGVVGDVGLEGIALGPDYPGNAYVAFQQRVLDLHRRGVVLALCSKNEPASVLDVLDRHPGMVLRREHFAALRINWEPKPANLQAIAAELNLGLDSFVFLDDSPVECDLVRTTLPEVTAIALPSEPAAYPGAIDALDCFDQWTLSEEDRRRGELYRAESQRRELQTVTMDLPTFYRQLQMTLTIAVDQPMHAARAAQLAARTNQFNMNTVRCSEDDIRRWMASPDHHVVTAALADRFGDNGIIGLAVIHRGPTEWMLDMLLMSCRILGRTVEQSFVRWLAAQARAAGATSLAARFVPTPKNQPFTGFYESCGFARCDEAGGAIGWTLSLASADTTTPDWINVTRESEDVTGAATPSAGAKA